jgi:hypothetical protein
MPSRRPVRATVDENSRQALQALGHGSCDSIRLPAPPPDEALEQLAAELAASLADLRAVEANYWDQDWRREHRGGGIYPESHLWNAVHGYLDLLSATP